MVATWRRAFNEAQREETDYFAWASDHDVWHPRWLETMVQELDRYEDVVLVYPVTVRISRDDKELPRPSQIFDTFSLTPHARVRAVTSLQAGAGNMVYGLFRAQALKNAGVFRPFLIPDMLLMLELSLFGSFKQVPEKLWYRRQAGKFSLKRQRASLFSEENPMPAYCHLPYWICHSSFLAWRSAVGSQDGADVTRPLGLEMALLYLGRRAYGHLVVHSARKLLRLGSKLGRVVKGN
jgi:hypothetical protein